MTYVADLHLHSHLARGTSKDLTFPNLARWAKIKGIDLLASADFTHPAWLREIEGQLREAGGGLYEHDGVRFVLGTEVSCSGRQGGRNRRVHMLVFAPDLDVVRRINSVLAGKGNLDSDGRPALRMTPRELVATLLEIDSRCMFIPAHAWTPWFGVFGSKSGFDSLEECFGDLIGHVHAVETGLSSEPAMNWRVPDLDGVSLVSFSDAHSLPNMGRELTAFEGDLTYDGLARSLEAQAIAYTVEFFPQEGKYHHSGHRKCGVRYSPDELSAIGRRCPVCSRPLTVGVLQRIEELAGRRVETWTDDRGFTRSDNGRPPFVMMVALRSIIAESMGVGPTAKRVERAYLQLVGELGNELSILMQAPPSEIARVLGERVAEGVARVRRGQVSVTSGYDGQYGTVQVWPDGQG